MKIKSISPEGQQAIEQLARMVATIHWSNMGKPADRSRIRARVIADARLALSGYEMQSRTAREWGLSGGSVRPDEALVTTAGAFRLAFVGAECNYSDGTVAESVMALVERAADAELSRPVPGA